MSREALGEHSASVISGTSLANWFATHRLPAFSGKAKYSRTTVLTAMRTRQDYTNGGKKCPESAVRFAPCPNYESEEQSYHGPPRRRSPHRSPWTQDLVGDHARF